MNTQVHTSFVSSVSQCDSICYTVGKYLQHMVSRCTSIIVVYVLSLKEVSLYKTLIHAIHLIALQCWLCNYIHRLSAVYHNVIVFVTVWTQWNEG